MAAFASIGFAFVLMYWLTNYSYKDIPFHFKTKNYPAVFGCASGYFWTLGLIAYGLYHLVMRDLFLYGRRTYHLFY